MTGVRADTDAPIWMYPMYAQDVPFPADAFRRLDESDDARFYATDRFVQHLDSLALSTIEQLVGGLVTEAEPRVLDLMASWDSHLPSVLAGATVVGLGLNERELAENPALSEHVLHDLNRDPVLPFPTDTFDAVLCTVSVDYLTRPVEVFRDVARVLKPGGLFLVTFSNRFFPPKVVSIWRDASEEERVDLVRAYFARSGGFAEPRLFVSKGRPRPETDRYAGLGVPSDPVYAVFADAQGGSGATRPLPDLFAVEREAVRKRKRAVSKSLRCPHCMEQLSKWEVPQTPFTQWSSTYQYVCFNDECPYYAGGWNTLAGQGNRGSHRFMYDPDSGGCHSMPVPSAKAFRTSIVSD